MAGKEKIKSLLRQAELYQSQGLLSEALEQYIHAGRMLKKLEAAPGGKKLFQAVAKKIKDLKVEIHRIDATPDMSEVPERVQDIIKDKFAFAESEETRDLEGAVALAKFGQYDRAIREFKALMDREDLKVDAAKNIIRCHVTLDAMADAIAQYRQWFDQNILLPEELNKLRVFLQSILDKKGFKETLPVKTEPAEASVGQPDRDEITDDADDQEDIIDISSVEITLEDGPAKGRTVEYDVSFQSGRVINLLISSEDKALVKTLKAGLELKKLLFYSPIAMFNGEGVVFSKSLIESGPKKGDYSLDIQIKRIR